ncbi:hypothetical protein AB833_25485 [Chromatiales bacterium (ex Bugula neritina AB1)]|nr:hypothetical protein AB833_25485 [Chromatiales bacterium (ex Bugula neritina AB1)]
MLGQASSLLQPSKSIDERLSFGLSVLHVYVSCKGLLVVTPGKYPTGIFLVGTWLAPAVECRIIAPFTFHNRVTE